MDSPQTKRLKEAQAVVLQTLEAKKWRSMIFLFPALRPEQLMPKVARLDKAGKPIPSKFQGDQYMMLDAVVDPTYVAANRDGSQWGQCIQRFTTPKAILDGMDRFPKNAINKLKAFLHCRDSALVFHNGTMDDGCEINGLHVHAIVSEKRDGNVSPDILAKGFSPDTKFKNQASVGDVRRAMSAAGGVMRSKEIVDMQAFIDYLLCEPRCYFGATEEMLRRAFEYQAAINILENKKAGRRWYTEEEVADMTMPEMAPIDPEEEIVKLVGIQNLSALLGYVDPVETDNPETPMPSTSDPMLNLLMGIDSTDGNGGHVSSASKRTSVPLEQYSGAKTPRLSNAANNIDKLLQVMRDTGIDTEGRLKMHLMQGKDIAMRNLAVAMNWRHLFENAAKMYREELSDQPIELLIKQNQIGNPVSVLYMCHLLNDWCNEYGYVVDDFVCAVQVVLHKLHPKKHMLYLLGTRNVGKTFWVSTMLPDARFVGWIQSSVTFPYGPCVGKKIVLMDEGTHDANILNEIKKVCGCIEPVSVSVKYQVEGLMCPTPHLVTGNQPLWKMCPNEEKPLKSRMYMFKFPHPSAILADLDDIIVNKGMWEYLFGFYTDAEALQMAEGEISDIRIEQTFMKKSVGLREPIQRKVTHQKAAYTQSRASKETSRAASQFPDTQAEDADEDDVTFLRETTGCGPQGENNYQEYFEKEKAIHGSQPMGIEYISEDEQPALPAQRVRHHLAASST